MNDLYPTKSRRDLLGAVSRGMVYLGESGQIMRRTEGRFPLRVSADIRLMVSAGWVQLGSGDVYELTDAGWIAYTGSVV